MKRLAILALVVTAALAALSPPVGATATPTWNDATAVPGMGPLGALTEDLDTVGCIQAGFCIAGGAYSLGNTGQVFFAPLVGTVQDATTLPALDALNTGSYDEVAHISCGGTDPATARCNAIGTYTVDRMAGTQSIWVTTDDGLGAIEVPGLATINVTGQNLAAGGISCWAPHNCSAVGSATNGMHVTQVFVVDLIDGVWGNAQLLGGLASANAYNTSISCWSGGNCVMTGEYTVSVGLTRAFTASRANGSWGTAIDVPGVAALNSGDISNSGPISCAGDGHCWMGGTYLASPGVMLAWISQSTNGTWSDAQVLGAMDQIAGITDGRLTSISCWSSTQCVAVGSYDAVGITYAYAADALDSLWHIPGIDALGTGDRSTAESVSCATDGLCAIIGKFQNTSSITQAYALVRSGGVWGTATEIPGLAALNTGNAATPKSVACVPGGCMAVGYLMTANSGYHAWITTLVDVPEPEPTTTTASVDPVTPAFTG